MTTKNDTYLVYTFRISSPIQLPGLQPTNGEPDVTIEYGYINTGADTASVSDEIQLSYDGIGTFEIRSGKRVVIDPVEEISDTALQPYVIGPILGAVLYQRGYLVLHASSVSICDTAVAFLGHSGAGKSTIAAACQERGHTMLSDDITAVEIVDEKPIVTPGLPLLKLTPEFADGFDIGRAYPSAGPGDKQLYRAPSGVPRSTRPLERLYVLADGELRTEKMSAGETVQALVGHTYTQSLLDETSIGDHFRQCTRVADTAEISRLSRPRDLDLLSDTVQQIEREIG